MHRCNKQTKFKKKKEKEKNSINKITSEMINIVELFTQERDFFGGTLITKRVNVMIKTFVCFAVDNLVGQ